MDSYFTSIFDSKTDLIFPWNHIMTYLLHFDGLMLLYAI